ncbi:MAG: hypothetical protein J5850_06200 [Clostridia bacterium]|nr:hypothetical protein [Clostridia bacterium]
MKKRFIIICILSAFICSLSVFSANAESDILTEDEAKDLVFRAHSFYFTYQDGINDFRVHKSIKTTKEAVAKEAREIYVDEISDGMWMNQCSGSPQGTTPNNNGLTFVESDDGTISTISFLAQYCRRFFILKEYSQQTWYQSSSLPANRDDINLRNFNTGEKEASAEVLMCEHIGHENDIEPIWVNVIFSNTSDGWRISGGNIIFAFSDWNNTGFVYTKQFDLYFLIPYLAEPICSRAVKFNDPDCFYNYPVLLEEDSDLFSDYKLISFDQNSITYEFVYKPTGKRLSAIFTEDKDYQYWQYDYLPETYHGSEPNGKEVKGAWRLSGGTVYTMAINQGYAPSTGDRTGALIAITVASLLSLSACMIVRRKAKAG